MAARFHRPKRRSRVQQTQTADAGRCWICQVIGWRTCQQDNDKGQRAATANVNGQRHRTLAKFAGNGYTSTSHPRQRRGWRWSADGNHGSGMRCGLGNIQNQYTCYGIYTFLVLIHNRSQLYRRYNWQNFELRSLAYSNTHPRIWIALWESDAKQPDSD